jgi:hypothetical protein
MPMATQTHTTSSPRQAARRKPNWLLLQEARDAHIAQREKEAADLRDTLPEH